LLAQGHEVGKSLVERDQLETAKRIMAKAESGGATVLLPTDVVVAREFRAGASSRIVGITGVDEDEMILDVGPRTIQAFGRQLDKMKTVVWNGPFGAFEIPPFDRGTSSAAQAVAERTERTQAALPLRAAATRWQHWRMPAVVDDFTTSRRRVGAFLEWLEGRTLPWRGGVADKMRESTMN
jgi:phosphoglycerate kinase